MREDVLWTERDASVAGMCSKCVIHLLDLTIWLLHQAKAFINRFHEEKSKQVAHIVENEQWAQAEVPVDFQRLVSLFFSNNPSSPDRLHSSDDSLEKQSVDEDDLPARGSVASLNGALGDTAKGKSQRTLSIDEQKYNVVACVLLFLKMLTEYMQCMENIPALTTDVLNRIADILKVGDRI